MAKGKNWKKLKSKSETKSPDEIDFFRLISDGFISKYQSCEIETVYSNIKHTKNSTILFAKLTFSEKSYSYFLDKNFFEFKLESPKGKIHSFGHLKQSLTVEEGIEIYENLKLNKWILNSGFDIEITDLDEKYPRFVKADSRYVKDKDKDKLSVLLGIKSGYDSINNGSYVIEFADCKKTRIEHFFSHQKESFLEKIQNELTKVSDINLLDYSDKVGNVFFELPINCLSLKRLNSDCKIRVELKNYVAPYPNIDLIYTFTPIDGKPDVYLQKLPKDKIIKFKFNQKPFVVTLYDRIRGIVLAQSNNCEYEKPNAGKSQAISIYNRRYNRLVRSIIIDDELIDMGLILHRDNEIILEYEDWIRLRKNENLTTRNRKHLIAKEYAEIITNPKSTLAEEHKKAIDDVRQLMKMHGRSGIYLIDPYIAPAQILKTFYLHEVAGVEMKIIGDKDHLKNLFKGTNWRSEVKDFMDKSSNHFGINLEFRIGFGVDNFNLHDRFLIFPFSHSEKRPVAWSLGTSLNSVGKSFHILTKVDNARAILSAFEKLWEKTSGEECVVYKKSVYPRI